ncbi:head decoration protein, partial [Escherichia coli]|nr:head decoration protein [Escherichia coli]EFB4116951.1 head decoration protein [Escherichia coli]EFB4126565.1 head decoration protein [Escherichia coli]EFE0747882.1 head decoration protein [Escherichia coli]EFI3313682.1 head decoration protein [Escherichia coli]
MVTKTITEQRAEVRIFAGNDPAHTATGSSGISQATPALTPLMLDEASGKLVV